MDYGQVIYDRGCLRAGEDWVERNLVPGQIKLDILVKEGTHNTEQDINKQS